MFNFTPLEGKQTIVVKNKFSIKDLENLCGVKAHTIRIWEKRYELFEPLRTETNIRYYTLDDLRKILNVSYLNNIGYKISAIANLSVEKIESEVSTHSVKANSSIQAIQELKVAMINFDQHLFQRIYEQAAGKSNFKEVFANIIIPFVIELGTLWHSKTINIAHEHFISYLIRQKLLLELETVQYHGEQVNDNIYILFLPDNEMHDLGLLFLNYELLSKGYKTIYLGPSVPLDSLSFFETLIKNPVYVSYFTIFPTYRQIPAYLNKFNRKVAGKNKADLFLLGNLAQKIKNTDLDTNHHIMTDISTLVERLSQVASA